MNLIFFTSKDVNSISNGGELCTNRNYLSFCDILGKRNVTVVNLLENRKVSLGYKITKRVNLLFGLNEGLSKRQLMNYLEFCNDYSYVFIDSSLYGILAYHLKKKQYGGQIITFYHNVEQRIKFQKLKFEPWKIIDWFVSKINEKRAWVYSDKVITVNARDLDGLTHLYGERKVSIIPISLIDRYTEHGNQKVSVPPKCVFTGNNWYANIHGINWFIENVLDHVDIVLQITGHRMELLSSKYSHEKIDFLGFVDNIDSVFYEADFVLSPIFIGSGMKVKTCEALMFGKNIIGTSESFEGYAIDPLKVGAVCNTKEEFIVAIKEFCKSKIGKINNYNRKIFLNKYSYKATYKSFELILEH